ncbi:MAG: glucose-6-phosphate isomerase [Gammaproteobacteria bacterium]|nr:glucose-6-phosphate isomerase [Gammaproteobacteria bacterium]
MTISRLSIDSAGFKKDIIGDSGVTDEEIAALSPRLDALRARIKQWQSSKEVNFFNLPDTTDLDSIAQLGRKCAHKFKHTIVFGIGGSSLGAEMLARTLGHRSPRNQVKFYDNIDPRTFDEVNEASWADTLCIVVSKSGNTAETLSQFLTVLPRMERYLGAEGVREHTIIITENTEGALYKIALQLGIEPVAHPAVGGRFSVLTVVGLLPAYISGVDISGVMEGARAMAKRCAADDMLVNPAFANAAAQYLHTEKGRTISVFMPYADNLRLVVNWYRQLWAESLGKIDAQGRHRGMTPIENHGVTDQHSQLQLMLDGPDDKQVTFIANPGVRHEGRRIPMRFQELPAVAPLAGHTLGELFISELKATRETLSRRGRPNRTFGLYDRDAYAIGELIMLLEMETVVMAELMGVDAFDQPAVEESKVLTREYLGDLLSPEF